jgi:peptide-methionine (R)-S-oxide reductase
MKHAKNKINARFDKKNIPSLMQKNCFIFAGNKLKMKVKSDEEWLQELGEESFRVLRQKGTERPHKGVYNQFWEEGVYVCKGCGSKLFEAKTKFDAGCGWPSFYDSIDKSNVLEKPDYSHGMNRIEVLCANCDGHLGHVFTDGHGKPTGLRYCINSASLGFEKKVLGE